MLKVKKIKVLLSSFQVREVSRGDDGARLLVRLKFEHEDPKIGDIPFSQRAVSAILSDSAAIVDDDGPNSFSIRAKISFPVGAYTIRMNDGDTRERAAELLEELATIDVLGPIDRFHRIRKLVAGKARAIEFSGSTIGKAEIRVVEGKASLVWVVEANLSPDDASSLAVMLGSENLFLDCDSVQTELSFDDMIPADPDKSEKLKAARKKKPSVLDAITNPTTAH